MLNSWFVLLLIGRDFFDHEERCKGAAAIFASRRTRLSRRMERHDVFHLSGVRSSSWNKYVNRDLLHPVAQCTRFRERPRRTADWTWPFASPLPFLYPISSFSLFSVPWYLGETSNVAGDIGLGLGAEFLWIIQLVHSRRFADDCKRTYRYLYVQIYFKIPRAILWEITIVNRRASLLCFVFWKLLIVYYILLIFSFRFYLLSLNRYLKLLVRAIYYYNVFA